MRQMKSTEAQTTSFELRGFGHPSGKQTVAALGQILPEARFFDESVDDIRATRLVEFQGDAPETDASDDQTWSDAVVVYRIGQCEPVQLIAEAMARGAAGILTEQLLPCPLPQCIVPDVEHAAARIEATLIGRPDRQMLTVGVLGSTGKTTASLLVAAVLRDAQIRTAYQTDLGESDGVLQTTPEHGPQCGSDSLRWLAEAVDAGCQAAVIELTDADLRHGRHDAIEFDVLIATGRTVAGHDFGPTGLNCALERLTPEGVLILSADDQVGMRSARDAGVRMVTYSLRGAADVTAKIIDQADGVTTSLVNYDDTTIAMETMLSGGGMLADQLASVAFGLLIDRPLHRLVETMHTMRSFPGRMQQITCEHAANAVIDVAGNPTAITSAIRAARASKGQGKLWCVFSIRETHSSEDLAEVGHLIERFGDQAVITTSKDQKRSFLKRSHDVLDGVTQCAAFRLVADSDRALQWAISEAGADDTVLVLCGASRGNARTERLELESLANNIRKQQNRQPKKDRAGGSRPRLRIVGAR